MTIRIALAAALICLAHLSAAQTKFVMFLSGRKAGTATVQQKILADGGKSVNLSLTLSQGDKTVGTIRSETLYDSKGRPVRKFQEASIPSQRLRRTIIVTFDAKGANAVVDINGKRTTKAVPLPDTVERADATEFWFIRDKPKVGQVVKAYNFSLETLTWALQTTTYTGVVEATVNGKKVKAHRTESKEGVALIDDQGMPYKLELPQGALERAW